MREKTESTWMHERTFSEVKESLAGKPAVLIEWWVSQKRKALEAAIASNRIGETSEVKRILEFCTYIQDTLELPRGLSHEGGNFYKLIMEKLVKAKRMPRYVLDVFENGIAPEGSERG